MRRRPRHIPPINTMDDRHTTRIIHPRALSAPRRDRSVEWSKEFYHTTDSTEIWNSDNDATIHITADSTNMYDCVAPTEENENISLGI